MQLTGIGWVGVRTAKITEMVAFCRDTLGLRTISHDGDFAEFALANGDRFEIFGADHPGNPYMADLAVEFLVDDIEQARAELELRDVEFLIPIRSDDAGMRWTHFRAADGRIYGLVSRD